MNEDKKAAVRPPGRKGGSRYPRTDLKKAIGYAKRLVGKTHTGPQPEAIILPGVFDSATDAGVVRASSLKQYGLMDGSTKGYLATDLSKEIAAAPPEELTPLLQRAFFNASVFKQMYDTYQGDDVSKSKLRQKALSLGVHLDLADKCVELFLTSSEFAGLATLDGENIHLLSLQGLSVDTSTALNADPATGEAELNPKVDEQDEKPTAFAEKPLQNTGRPSASARAGVTVNFDITSSLDTDKLRVQLELLRKFGVI